MKNKNKGYSLVELLLTLAVFSIMMVTVLMIMRTTIASYKEGLFETELQEEAQIVANQVSDLLIDVTSVDSKTLPYKFKNEKGEIITIELSGNTLSYSAGAKSGDLSNRISSFSISDIDLLPTLTEEEVKNGKKLSDSNFDNAVLVEIGFLPYGNRKEYKITRTVYFRNNVESKLMYDVDEAGVSGADDSDDDNIVELEVNRYGEYNLTSLYGIYKIVTTGGEGKKTDLKGMYEFKQEPVEGASFHDANSCYILTCNATLRDTFTTSIDRTDKALVVGYYKDKTGKDRPIKVALITKPVNIIDKIKLVEEDGTETEYMMTVGYPEQKNFEKGYHTYVPVEGIDIGAAIGKISMTYTMDYIYDGNAPKSTSSQNIQKGSSEIGTKSDQIAGIAPSNGRIEMGLLADPFSNGLMVSTNNQNFLGIHYTDDTKAYVVFHINLNGTPYDKKYRLYVAGQSVHDAANSEF